MYNTNQEYIYFLCPKSVNEEGLSNEQLASRVKNILDAGLIVDDGFTLEDSFVKVREGMVEECAGGVEEVIQKFLAVNSSVDFVTVVKIPKQYLGIDKFDLEEGQVGMDLPLPFCVRKKDESGRIRTGITKSLIDGIYSNRFEDYVVNTNYNPAIDPSGLFYTEEQLAAMKDIGNNEWFQFASDRNNMEDSYVLREEERANDFWNQYVEEYMAIYPQQSTNNPMPIIRFRELVESEEVELDEDLIPNDYN